jgi:transposase
MKALDYKPIERKYELVKGQLDERRRRLWAGAEARELGYGGIRALARATGLAPDTIRRGMRELGQAPAQALPTARQRKPGGGNKPVENRQAGLLTALAKLVEPHTRGDPMRPLRWTSKSIAKLAAELKKQGWRVSANTVGRLLRQEGYSLQANRKRDEGRQHPDRNAQFEHIAGTVEQFQKRGCPVISVDAKKK